MPKNLPSHWSRLWKQAIKAVKKKKKKKSKPAGSMIGENWQLVTNEPVEFEE